jgi:signal transduction histidine kinase
MSEARARHRPMPSRARRHHIRGMGKLDENLRHAVVVTDAEAMHDLNNLIGALVTAASVLRAHVAPESRASELASEIHTTAERAASLVRRTLVTARTERKTERLEVGAVLREMEPLLRRIAGEHVSLTIDSSERSGRVAADRDRLEHVVLNLVTNARDATPRGGHIRVTAAELAPDHDGRAYATITVADTGAGMTHHVRERIFEPFFTTKLLGHGTGLGLPSAQRFASESGGTIAVHSELNRGTAVVLYLPCVA